VNESSVHTDLIVTLLIGMVIFLLLVGFIITFILIYQRRRIRQRQLITELTVNFEHELLKSQLEIQEQTLQTISEEVHDNIGQVLTLAKLTLAEGPEDATILKEQRATSRQLISKAISDLRDLSKSLSTDKISEIGLTKAIELQLAILNRTGQLTTGFCVSGDMMSFPEAQELMIFRIFQELMNNTIKHAQARHLEVQLDCKPEGLWLITSDNGCGFDTANRPGGVHSGLGLKSIEKRVALFHGTIKIMSKPDEGTRISIFFPSQVKAS
jgi:two-component system, NarL family, sensor kinase